MERSRSEDPSGIGEVLGGHRVDELAGTARSTSSGSCRSSASSSSRPDGDAGLGSSTASSAKIGVPMRAARAMASDGRLETLWLLPLRGQLDLGEERAVAQLGDHDRARR